MNEISNQIMEKEPQEISVNIRQQAIETGLPVLYNETKTHFIYAMPDGLFQKFPKYEKVWTTDPKDQDTLEEIYMLMNSDDLLEMKTNMDKEFVIQDFYTNPYPEFDEELGMEKQGVTTLIVSTDGEAFVTSSKVLYRTLIEIHSIFGLPRETGREYKVKIFGTKKENGTQIDLKIVPSNKKKK